MSQNIQVKLESTDLTLSGQNKLVKLESTDLNLSEERTSPNVIQSSASNASAEQLTHLLEKLTIENNQLKLEKEKSISALEHQLAVQNEKHNSLTEELNIARCILYAKNKEIANLKEKLSKSNEKLESSLIDLAENKVNIIVQYSFLN